VLASDLIYSRESEDRMTISADVSQSGYLRINEAWDPGWHATVDGKPTQLIAGDDVFLTLPLVPGDHKVQFEFSTPGFPAGCVVSVICLALLVWTTRSKTRIVDSSTSS
jgi:uncharacterized membrane protein YfhO